MESLLSLGEIGFNVYEDEPGSVLVADTYPEAINVTLVSAVQNPVHSILGNLTSEMTVTVTNNTLGKRVYCSDGRLTLTESPYIVIRKQGNC